MSTFLCQNIGAILHVAKVSSKIKSKKIIIGLIFSKYQKLRNILLITNLHFPAEIFFFENIDV